MTANIQIQDMLYSGKTVTLYKIFMMTKALPLAFWAFPKLFIRALLPIKHWFQKK